MNKSSAQPDNRAKGQSLDNPVTQLKELFVDVVQQRRIDLGQKPAQRPVFLKPHGVAWGSFEMQPDLPDELEVGIFALKKLDAWVRFSSDSEPTMPDLRTTCGVGIKVFGVPGPKLLGDGETQDFILQNYDVFFVDNAREMAKFTAAAVVDKDPNAYLAAHPQTKKILEEMAQVVVSSLSINYWSVLPYAFGPDRYVKYKLEPMDQPPGEPFDDDNYLALDLQNRLRSGPARFKFLVQFRTNPKTMRLDKATVRWSETESVPVHVATLHLPQQDICQNGQAEYGENLAFNPWHCLPEHEPQGSLSAARKVVYQASAEKRHFANGIPTQEPQSPRRPTPMPESFYKDGIDDRIVSAAIYPPIGVCRVGNSQAEFFIGPEVPDPLPMQPGFYRDANGALKRQAARFRIYGLNAKGAPVRELTANEATITWRVHLVNQKSAWYEFQLALDIPEEASAPPSLLRNATIADRRQLIIDPGPSEISSVNQRGAPFSGQFMGIAVYLGELRTDDAGRLIVLGGHGVSASYDGRQAVTFANNDSWHDDTSDGPVTAEVQFEGNVLSVQPAWVITAPPDYAPMQKSVRTMWDLMRDTAIKAELLPQPPLPSFRQDILPIFERLTNLQWVNAGFASAFGFGAPFNFTTSDWARKLSDPTPANREMRKVIANQFREFARDSWSPVPLPWLYGDAMNIPPAMTPRQHASLTDTQMCFLQQWAAGEFIADYDPEYQPPRQIDQVPPEQQPDLLTRAAMEFCLADAFHPGCEMTWPMRTPGIYNAPFRVKHATSGWQEPSYGMQLILGDVSSASGGPLTGGQVPGSITRWMAVPWQTDTASCRSGYDKTYDPYLPTFWPARVPNQVMSEADYNTVLDTNKELGQRLQAFANRANWLIPLGLDKGYIQQINHMIHHFDEMGVVEMRQGLTDDPNFPPVMQVQDAKPAAAEEHPQSATTRMLTLRTEQSNIETVDVFDLTQIDKVRRFRPGTTFL